MPDANDELTKISDELDGSYPTNEDLDREFDFGAPAQVPATREQGPQKVMVHQEQNLPGNPAQLVELALRNNQGIEVIERMVALQERWEAKEARKAYADAMAQFQGLLPEIVKRKQVFFEGKNGKADTNYFYAPLADIMAQIKEPMEICGLHVSYGHRFLEGGLLEVTAKVTHRLGHTETTSIPSALDTSGNKSGVQQIGSTITFLSRYAVCGLLGISTADEDMDGRLAADTITPAQATALKARIGALGAREDKFCQALSISDINSMPISKYSQADTFLTQREVKIGFGENELK